MTLLDRFRPRASQAAAAPHQPERRGTPRYPVDRAITVTRARLAPVAGTLVNLSESGAALRVTIHNRHGLALWPAGLKNGDEVAITGLLDEPVACWVVGLDKDLLRVRFAVDAAMRRRLRHAIETWTRSDA